MSSKVIHTEFDEKIAFRFSLIKSHLGLKNDGEVIRFLVSNYYNDKLAKTQSLNKQAAIEEYESEIEPMLNDFMKKYGDQWRRLGED